MYNIIDKIILKTSVNKSHGTLFSPQPVVSDIDGDGLSGEQMCGLWAGLAMHIM